MKHKKLEQEIEEVETEADYWLREMDEADYDYGDLSVTAQQRYDTQRDAREHMEAASVEDEECAFSRYRVYTFSDGSSLYA